MDGFFSFLWPRIYKGAPLFLGGYRKKTITMGPHAAAAISLDFPHSHKMVYGKVYRECRLGEEGGGQTI